MKSHVSKIAIARRLPLILVLLLGTAAFTFPISAARQQTEPGAAQAMGNPSTASAGEVQQARSASEDQASAPQSAEPVPAAMEQTLKAEMHVLPQPPGTTAQQ
ncbi:MAG TPA: hypothetical protein VEF34_03275, partial [Syntrophobacteraceae bacterium]|nr:hypothetical protein [Syntrophobacteraceae bacterium]